MLSIGHLTVVLLFRLCHSITRVHRPVNPSIRRRNEAINNRSSLSVQVRFRRRASRLLLPFRIGTSFQLVRGRSVELIILRRRNGRSNRGLLLADQRLVEQRLLACLIRTSFINDASSNLTDVLRGAVCSVLRRLLQFTRLLDLRNNVQFTALGRNSSTITSIRLVVRVLTLRLRRLPIRFNGRNGICLISRLNVRR